MSHNQYVSAAATATTKMHEKKKKNYDGDYGNFQWSGQKIPVNLYSQVTPAKGIFPIAEKSFPVAAFSWFYLRDSGR